MQTVATIAKPIDTIKIIYTFLMFLFTSIMHAENFYLTITLANNRLKILQNIDQFSATRFKPNMKKHYLSYIYTTISIASV